MKNNRRMYSDRMVRESSSQKVTLKFESLERVGEEPSGKGEQQVQRP